MVCRIILVVVVCFLSGCDREFHPDNFDGDYGFASASQYTEAEIELGRSLFFDKILSGNKNISCATCHHPSAASADGLSLSFGEGGIGVGPDRSAGKGESKAHRILPRNSPALFNLGSKKITTLFHDGRVEQNRYFPNGVFSPEGKNLPHGLESMLAVQAMFPVTSTLEMAGFSDENKMGKSAIKNRRGEVWTNIADRVRYTARYSNAIQQVYGVSQMGVRYIDIANAIAAFVDVNFRSVSSPFDAYIQGDKKALTQEQKKGMSLFYGKAKCSSCHAGVFQTDNRFYSIGLPQIGPGKIAESVERLSFSDFGRELVTKSPQDRYKFRTPSLRNVELTAPYGHNGAYRELETIVDHHLEPERMMRGYQCEESILLPYSQTGAAGKYDCWFMKDEGRREQILETQQLPTVKLSSAEKVSLIEFLKSLTDDLMRDRKDEVPESVFSGLPVED